LTIGLSTKNTSQNGIKGVLDSAATNHLTGNLNLLNNYRKINDDYFFTVANNGKIKIQGWVMISIFPKKIIQDLFYVNNCSINILPISNLSKDLNCEVIFKKKKNNFSRFTYQGEDW
jgi:hypothetical protein